MKKIIVPTDFSPCAANALNFAIQTAKTVPAEITLLNSFELQGSIYTDYMGVNKEFNRTMIGDAQKKLDTLKEEIDVDKLLNIDSVISTKPLNDAIKEVAENKNADMVVMGTLGATGLKEKLWGSRTSAFIENTNIPVIVVPDEYEWKQPQKILFATDHFEKDVDILHFLFDLAKLYNAQVHVMVFGEETFDKARKYAERNDEIPWYEEFLKKEYDQDVIITSHISGDSFDTALNEFINANDIDILAMVMHQRNFWERIFRPSKTKTMSYHTKIPLLAIPQLNNPIN